ncbi:hypothetical protein BGX20_007499 [Mortierella sp. AD010]|nr:hypothetical protein BGX20_007499 [Mortierella sp. AD010]
MTNNSANSPSDSPITLNVKTIESQTHSVSISVNETVSQLKERLAELLEVPCPRQRLISRGRVMVDDKQLTEYSLEDGHTIHLVTRPADAPSNRHNDAPRTSTGTTAGSAGLPRLDTRDILFSFIGVDDNIDPQNIMQALAGNAPTDMDFDGPPTVIQIDGDPSTIRSILGNNAAPLGIGRASDYTRSRLRALANANRPVPLGASLPHLATIDAELTRAERQLRNVQTILAHPVDQLDGVELEPLDVPGLDSVEEDVDGDSIELARISRILTQLSESSRSMANSLQDLSTQYRQSLLPLSERANLQRGSVRAARAMYRLASVQNTVFPMLANASFVGTAPDAVTYRFQPSSRGNLAHFDAPEAPHTAGNTGARTSNPQRGPSLHAIPIPIVANRGAGTGSAPLIRSIMAHARASAQGVNAALMTNANNSASRATNTPSTVSGSAASSSSRATATTASTSMSTAPTATHQFGSGPFGHMVLGPNGSLSYSLQTPPRTTSRNISLPTYAAVAAAAANPFSSHRDQASTSRLMIPADFSGAGFLDFWRSLSGQISSMDSVVPSPSLPTAQAALANAFVGVDPAASTRAGQGATESLERAISASLSSRRRERPEDLSNGIDGRATSRRRLSTTQSSSSSADVEIRTRQEPDQLQSLISGPTSTAPSASNLTSRPISGSSSSTAVARSQLLSRSAMARSSSSDTRRSQAPGNSTDSSSTTSSPSPNSSSVQSSPTNNSSNNASSSTPAYNLGRLGVFISAILRMVDQPREDGSPRTLADVICNDPEPPSTLLQGLLRDVAESVTIREARQMIEGHPAPMRNIHPILNTFIRDRALNGQQLTESNLDTVAVMFANAIMNAVHVEEIMETLSPPASIQISSEDIRRISSEVLREHFRRLIYLVVAVPTGRESNWPTFARDLILWIRDVVGSWRVAFYSLFQERDQAEAQRIATHVVCSAIHANGRRWVELSNRATNTFVNVLCANIVPRRREEQGGLVGGAWPLMATGPRQNTLRSQICMAPSLLGSTAPPAPLGPSLTASRTLDAETLSENLTRRLSQIIAPLGLGTTGAGGLTASFIRNAIRDAIRAELNTTRTPSNTPSSGETPSAASGGASVSNLGSTPTSASVLSSSTSTISSIDNSESQKKPPNSRRTRVEEVEDEDMSK